MPLSDMGGLAVVDFDRGGIAFQMADGQTKIRVLVTDEALEDIAEPPINSLERFEAFRERFAAIASERYDDRRIEPTGDVIVESADVC